MIGLHRIKRRALSMGLVALLAALSLMWLAFAGFLALMPLVGPTWAAAVIALVFLVLATLVAWLSGRRPRRPPSRGRRERDPVEAALRECLDPSLYDWVDRHPDRSALVALVLGVAAGSSPGMRKRILGFLAGLGRAMESNDR